MSRQIQFRRGTASEHNDFTGAIGEVTMDTDNKTLRVHDGETVGGTALAKQSEIPDLGPLDYVIEWQIPNDSNSYTWYRKYKSGWVEQGGTLTIERQNANTDLRTNVNFPIEMADDKYQVMPLTFIEDGGMTTGLRNHQNQRYTTYLRIGTFSTASITKAYTVQWSVCGYAK